MITEIPPEVTTPDVFLHYFYYLLYIVIDFFVALGFARLLKSKCPKLLTEKNLAILLIVSSGILLLAGIGKVGWSIQTFSGTTQPENVNNYIFQGLSFFGGFLLFTYLSLTFLMLKKEDN